MGRPKIAPIKRTCRWCGKPFYVKRVQFCCSLLCANKLSRTQRFAAAVINRATTCSHCSRVFLILQYRSGARFCSRACAAQIINNANRQHLRWTADETAFAERMAAYLRAKHAQKSG